MDSLTTLVPAVPATANDGERGRKVAERLFFRRDEVSETKSLFERRFTIKRARGGRRINRSIGLAVLGVCAVGLLLYGSARRMGEANSGSVTTVLPAPTRSGAAITNLPPPDLLRPLSPREASKENADRPFVARPDTPASGFVLRTDPQDRSRAITCLAQAVYYEAGGEGSDGGRAVAQVVLNRLHHPGFPSTVCGVVYQGGDRLTGCQFSFVCDGSMQRIPSAWLWARSREIAEEALSGKVYAPVGHATHYHADYVLPYWADSLDKSAQLGHHIFYRLRSMFGDGRAFSQRYGGTEPEAKVPGAAIVIPPAAVTPQLANALIGDGVQGIAKDIEKAATAPGPAPLVDSTRGTLLADRQNGPQQSRQQKQSGECAASSDRKQLGPLRANDIRSSLDAPGC